MVSRSLFFGVVMVSRSRCDGVPVMSRSRCDGVLLCCKEWTRRFPPIGMTLTHALKKRSASSCFQIWLSVPLYILLLGSPAGLISFFLSFFLFFFLSFFLSIYLSIYLSICHSSVQSLFFLVLSERHGGEALRPPPSSFCFYMICCAYPSFEVLPVHLVILCEVSPHKDSGNHSPFCAQFPFPHITITFLVTTPLPYHISINISQNDLLLLKPVHSDHFAFSSPCFCILKFSSVPAPHLASFISQLQS